MRAPVSLGKTIAFSTGTAVSGTGGGGGGLGVSCASVAAPSAKHSAAVNQPSGRFTVASDVKGDELAMTLRRWDSFARLYRPARFGLSHIVAKPAGRTAMSIVKLPSFTA
jgi:hypothetical protein